MSDRPNKRVKGPGGTPYGAAYYDTYETGGGGGGWDSGKGGYGGGPYGGPPRGYGPSRGYSDYEPEYPPRRGGYGDYYHRDEYPPPRQQYSFYPSERGGGGWGGKGGKGKGRYSQKGRGKGQRAGGGKGGNDNKTEEEAPKKQMTKQYKTFQRMSFTMRVTMRLFEDLLPPDVGTPYLDSLSEWETNMRTDMANLDPLSSQVEGAKFVTKEDSKTWFDLTGENLDKAIEFLKEHPRYKESAESEKHYAELQTKMAAEGRHCSVVMARFLAWAISSLEVPGETRVEQMTNFIGDCELSTERDPELLAELKADSERRLKNFMKFSPGRSESDRVNCKPGTGPNHKQ